ncbi:DUF6223 family protein [Cellulomonas fengjieae]|uniref:Uncharacterized protein n=1 Tax=Cellulomonas fengjieae TaxID=2819978 RepID=A0ABS3SKD9_9CELL|nr:DUF6223 family protein [Cellulomonas fengjieae]MBO3085445.1 hypothetical protein [Cellulomonas fengjieae]QVI66006.1 hypothetical protein KG102_18365 [Cellulomonas fengjieae]
MRTPGALTSVRRALAAAGAVLVVTCALAAPAAAHAHVQAARDTSGLTSGRVGPTAVAVLALAGAVFGALALRRRAGRSAAVAAVALGLLGVVSGAVFAATADGGLGTGNGLGGAVVAVVLGALAVVLGGFVLARSRRARPRVRDLQS